MLHLVQDRRFNQTQSSSSTVAVVDSNRSSQRPNLSVSASVCVCVNSVVMTHPELAASASSSQVRAGVVVHLRVYLFHSQCLASKYVRTYVLLAQLR